MHSLAKNSIIVTLVIFIPMLLINGTLSSTSSTEVHLKQMLLGVGLLLGIVIMFCLHLLRTHFKKQ